MSLGLVLYVVLVLVMSLAAPADKFSECISVGTHIGPATKMSTSPGIQSMGLVRVAFSDAKMYQNRGHEPATATCSVVHSSFGIINRRQFCSREAWLEVSS